MYDVQKNTKMMKEVYKQCLQVKSAISHPRIMGFLRSMCAYVAVSSESRAENCIWSRRNSSSHRPVHSLLPSNRTDFFEAFKNYDEAGSGQRIQCLKYLVLANMLSESTIDPFESQETKPYKNDPQIASIVALYLFKRC
jgi:COP9 signalosome complex subunit 2